MTDITNTIGVMEGCAKFWSNLMGGFAAPAAAPRVPTGPATTPSGSSRPGEEAQTDATKSGAGGKEGQTTGTCCPPPPWMPTAWGEEGVSEYAGAKMNPRIAAYFKAAKFWGTDDSGGANAWCASLVAYVMKTAGYDIATDAFRAREWAERWPAGKKASRPVYGAIAVKTRKGGGHVGFVVGTVPDKPGYLAILGGNQGDSTNVRHYRQSDFHSFMVPKDYDYSCCVLEEYTGKATAGGSEA